MHSEQEHTSSPDESVRSPRAPLPGWVAAARDELRARRSARASRRVLERELAGYSTPSQRLELDAILSRYDPAEVAEIRKIVDRHRVA